MNALAQKQEAQPVLFHGPLVLLLPEEAGRIMGSSSGDGSSRSSSVPAAAAAIWLQTTAQPLHTPVDPVVPAVQAGGVHDGGGATIPVDRNISHRDDAAALIPVTPSHADAEINVVASAAGVVTPHDEDDSFPAAPYYLPQSVSAMLFMESSSVIMEAARSCCTGAVTPMILESVKAGASMLTMEGRAAIAAAIQDAVKEMMFMI
jgi:hypothetical protein